MQPGGQSIVDRFLAAKNTIVGQGIAKIVCKATTEELMGPKRKHIDCLLQATHEMNVSIPEVADLLIERSQNSSWVVSFKSLITIHHLMSYGNERFEAYMASHNNHLQSSIYVDRLVMPGGDMSTYIRRYSNYLNEKREAYKLMGYDFCKIKRGKDDGLLRTMPTEKLLKALPNLYKQLDAILLFEISPNELTNGIISSCFFLLIKDLVHLYAVYNDGIINLLEKYFDMNKKQCRDALDMYKKFIERTDKVSQYLKIAELYEQFFGRSFWGETSGLERTDLPDLSRAPSSLLEALENHLTHIEGKKMSSQSLVSKQQIEQDVRNFSNDFVVNTNDDPQKILEEEAKALEQFNKKKEATSSPPLVSTQTTINTNENGFGDTDFFSQKSVANGQQQLLTDDLFSLDTTSSQMNTNTFPAFQNVFDASAPPKQHIFDEILQPTSTSTNKNPIPIITNNQVVTKPLQSGDLNSSLNQLIDNLDIKDHSKIGKDHQWIPNDAKNQQKIGTNAGTMNAPGTTWPNSSAMSAPFGGMNVQSGNMWQPPPQSSMNNPFAAPNGSSQMNFGGMNNYPMSTNNNPFAAQPSNGNSLLNQQQVNDPFGSL